MPVSTLRRIRRRADTFEERWSRAALATLDGASPKTWKTIEKTKGDDLRKKELEPIGGVSAAAWNAALTACAQTPGTPLARLRAALKGLAAADPYTSGAANPAAVKVLDRQRAEAWVATLPQLVGAAIRGRRGLPRLPDPTPSGSVPPPIAEQLIYFSEGINPSDWLIATIDATLTEASEIAVGGLPTGATPTRPTKTFVGAIERGAIAAKALAGSGGIQPAATIWGALGSAYEAMESHLGGAALDALREDQAEAPDPDPEHSPIVTTAPTPALARFVIASR